MDYVLFGMGYGATLMLLGWALRTFGPERKYKNVDPEDIDQQVLQLRWIRFVQGLGGVIAIVGTAMVVFTFIVMLVNPDDETGAIISMAIWGFLVLSILIWCWFYVSSFGTVGIWSRDEGYGLRTRSVSTHTRAAEAGLSTTRVVPKPRIPVEDAEPEIGPQMEESRNSEDTLQGEETSDEEVTPYDDATQDSVEEIDASEADDSEPEYDFGDSTDTTVPGEAGGRSEAIRRLRERQSRTNRPTD